MPDATLSDVLLWQLRDYLPSAISAICTFAFLLWIDFKLAVAYLSRGLAAEAQGKNVIVGTIEPGIVITAMLGTVLRDPARFGGLTRFIEGLALPVDAVAVPLAKRILENTRSGAKLRPFDPITLWMRVLLAPFRAKRLTFPAR